MAYASLTIVLEKVTRLLTFNDKLNSAAENELQQLKIQVNILLSFVEQASKLPKTGGLLREGERQIMELAIAIEQTLEPYLVSRRAFYRKRLDLAQAVESLRKYSVEPMLEKAKELFQSMLSAAQEQMTAELDEFHEEQRKAESDKLREEQTKAKPEVLYEEQTTGESSVFREDPPIREDGIVLQDEIDTIMNRLTATSEVLDVISIIGMVGLGKTTLAGMIYKHPKTVFDFPIRIWVNVSGVFKLRDVLLKILKSFLYEDMSSCSTQELIDSVRMRLHEKFFLVVDNMWSIDIWNAIRDALPETNRESKVLITSRQTSVGRHVNLSREPHYMRFMTKKESRDLLRSIQFRFRKDHLTEPFIGIDSYLATQCDGLPLAVCLIGGFFWSRLYPMERSMERNVSMLNTVAEDMSMLLYTMAEDMSMFLGEVMPDEILYIVSSSYNRLPYDLKDCLLYLGIFPANSKIPIWTLISLWIAEGLIKPKWGKSLEETAEENLKVLIDMNLVIVDKTNHMGKVKTCRILVLIHAFCRLKAAITERDLFQEVKMSSEGTGDGPSISDIQECIRVCSHSGFFEYLFTNLSSQTVRSLVCFYKKPTVLDSERSSAIADAFPMLRVLATSSVKFKQFPKGFTGLIHLSYITLCGDDIKEIPEAMSKLHNLQTIVVDTKSLFLTIKANIWRMILLKHVKTKAAIILDIKDKEGDAGENLRSLSRLSPKSCTRGVFNRARDLKKLGIRGELATLDPKCLRRLFQLENLKLLNTSMFSKSAIQNELHSLPYRALNYFPRKLKILTLSATYLNWQDLSALGNIDTLQVLQLTNYAFIGTSWNGIGDCSFRSLEFLLIASTDLVLWEASTNHFPRLSSLVLNNCEKLSKIPMALAKSLKKLDIDNVSKSAVESAREIEKEKASTGFKLSINPLRG